MDYKNSILTVIGMNDRRSLSPDMISQLVEMVKSINISPIDEKEHGLVKWISVKAILSLLSKHDVELEFHDKRTTDSTLRVLTAKLKVTYDDLLDMIEGLIITLCAENITGPAPIGELLDYVGEIEERYSDSLYCKIQNYIEGLYEEADEDDIIEEKETPEIVTKNESLEDNKIKESVKVETAKTVEKKSVVVNDNIKHQADGLDIITVIKDLESAMAMTRMTDSDRNNGSVTLEIRVTNFKIKKEALDTIVRYMDVVGHDTSGDNMKTIIKLLKLAEEIQSFNNFNILHRVEHISEIKANVFKYLLNKFEK